MHTPAHAHPVRAQREIGAPCTSFHSMVVQLSTHPAIVRRLRFHPVAWYLRDFTTVRATKLQEH